MVIQDEGELPVEEAVKKNPVFEQLAYINPNNQLQDSEYICNDNAAMEKHTKKSRNVSGSDSGERVRSSRTKLKKKTHSIDNPSENCESSATSNEISSEDLEELRSVYKKCKLVIKKIESKYGHLLDLEEPGPSKKRRKNTPDDEESECQCALNKKIVFDEDGNEIIIDAAPSDHICAKRIKYSQKVQPNDLQIEYFNQGIELPDSLLELQTILRNPAIETTYRNLVIHKAKLIKQEHAFEFKFNKHSIIEKIKANMEEMLDFQGTNLGSMPGYIV